MVRSSKKLLRGKKYETLKARLADRLGADEAAALWARAESRLDGMSDQFSSLPKGERPQVEGFVLPTFAIYSELGAPELCQFFCRNDEVCYGDLDGIRFVRTGTLAKGADCCDFLIERA